MITIYPTIGDDHTAYLPIARLAQASGIKVGVDANNGGVQLIHYLRANGIVIERYEVKAA